MHPFKYSLKTQIIIICVLTVFILGAIFSFLSSSIFSQYYIDTIAYKHIKTYQNIVRNEPDLYNAANKINQILSGYILSLDNEGNLVESYSYITLKLNSGDYILQNYVPNLEVGIDISFNHKANIITALKTESNSYFFSSNLTPYEEKIIEIIVPENANYLYNQAHLEINYFDVLDETFTIRDNTSYFIDYDNPNYLYILNEADKTLGIIPLNEIVNLTGSIAKYLTFFYTMVLIILSLVIYYSFNQLFISPLHEISIVLKDMQYLSFNYSVPAFFNPEINEVAIATNNLKNKMKQIMKELNDKNHEITQYSIMQSKEFEATKELISALSHEVKTPLHVMQATIQAILDGIFTGDEVNEELENVLIEIEKTNDLMKEILEVFKVQRNQKQQNLEVINLCRFVEENTKELLPLINKHNHHLHLNIAKTDIFIKCNKNDMKRCLSNVILNAIVYSPDNSDITINISVFKLNYIVEVINSNVTINQEDLSKIFDPFYQVDKSRTKTDHKGNGLGLYLVKQVMENHKFEYGMENTNNGVKFYFIIPRTKQEG